MFLVCCLIVAYMAVPRPVDGAHVFGVPNMNFHSHSQVLLRLGAELVKRGHVYTHVVADLAKNKTYPENINILTYKTSFSSQEVTALMQEMATAADTGLVAIFQNLVNARDVIFTAAEDIMNSKQLLDTMNDTASLLLCDMSAFVCPLLADVLDKDHVVVVPVMAIEPYGYFTFGQPQALVVTPPFPSLTYLDTSFAARLHNVLTVPMWYIVFVKYYSLEHVWRRFASRRSPDYRTAALQSASMVLLSNDFAVEFPRSLPAHVKMIGPILPKPAGPLPAEYQALLSGPTMIASFGTVLSGFGNNLAQVLADGFAQLPLKVIWKHTEKIPQRLGNNTQLVSFFPQNDLLGDDRVKLFFTHGGGNSFFESVYHGVPMVCIPLFGDHYRSATLVLEKKIGIVLRKEELVRPEQITRAVKEILENPIYLKNVQKISAILKDRKNTPAEEGADWIEYVLRHDGAKHLRNPLIDLPFYQEYMLDVFIFLGVLLFLVVYLIYVCTRFVCRKCSSGGSASEDKQKTA